METKVIQTDRQQSRILLGEKISNLKNYLPTDKKVVVITDDNLYRHYHAAFDQFTIIRIGQGETNKNMDTMAFIMSQLIEMGVDRSCFVLGIGGGIVTDVAGFAASIFMRGVKFGFVSTSLLSMVDASVGGKNGVNSGGFKNMIGVFNQPEFVVCDYEMLHTLERNEFISGFAEIIKHGAIKDKDYFEYIEKNADKALAIDPEVIHELVKKSVYIKASVVEADEKEKGERKKLNFGHTFGHAIEKLTGIHHGEAVAIGMMMAVKASQKFNFISHDEAEKIKKVIELYHLPIGIDIKANDLFSAMTKDKKRDGDSISLILLKGIGSAVIHKMSYKELETLTYDLC